MDHAEVLDRLEASVVGPGKLGALDADNSAEGVELRRHLDSCDDCAQEYRAWSVATGALDVATPEDLEPRPEARARILAAVVATGASPPGAAITAAQTPIVAASRTAPRPAFLALAAAAALALFLLGAFFGESLGLTLDRGPAGVPASVVGRAERILQQPDHRSVTLSHADGDAGGALVWSPASQEVAVVSSELAEGPKYECYLERGSQRIEVGPMFESDGLYFWAGTMDDPGQAGDRFVIAPADSASPVLSGAL